MLAIMSKLPSHLAVNISLLVYWMLCLFTLYIYLVEPIFYIETSILLKVQLPRELKSNLTRPWQGRNRSLHRHSFTAIEVSMVDALLCPYML